MNGNGRKSKNERFADLLFDFAKIIFGGAIIAIILNLHYPPGWVLVVSVVVFGLCIIDGAILSKNDKDDKSDKKSKDDKHKKD